MLLRRGALFYGFRFEAPGQWDKRDKMRSMLLFHSAVSVFFCVPQQIQESKRRNSQQISATLRVVNAKIIGILCNNNCCRRFFTQFYDRIIIRNWRAFSVFDFYKDVFRVGVVHHNINFFSFFTAPEVTDRCGVYSFSSLIFCILAAMLYLLFEMGTIILIKYNTKLPFFQGLRVIISLPELDFSQTSGSSLIP